MNEPSRHQVTTGIDSRACGSWSAELFDVRSAFGCILVASIVFVLPMLVWGYTPGHDFGFHVGNWIDVAHQWREGNLFPRWATHANYGYGEPRFIFYPPVSWIVGSALSLFLPWKMVPGAFVFLTALVAGTSMFLLAREWLAPKYATVAAVAYLANPYAVMVVYKRMATAEMLASAIFPLFLLFAFRVLRLHCRAMLPLAAVYAFIWLTNAPSAVMASYIAALLVVITVAHTRRVRAAFDAVASLAIGLGLAAFYIVPAAWEQKWVDISLALTLPHNRPENNFIRLFPPRLPGGITSIVTVGAVNLALVAVVFLLAIRRRNELPREWRAFAVLAAFAAVFTIPPSLIFWKLLPKMIFVQLPWRWLFVVNTAGAFLLAAILPTVSTRTKRIAIALPTLVLLALLATYATKGKPGQVAELQEKLESYGGYWAEAMYLPRGEVRGPAPDRSLVNGDNVAIESLRREGEKVVFRSNARQPARLQLALSWFPAWRVKVNGNSAPAIDDGGQVAVDVPAGTSNVEIDFVRTPDRRLGNALSLCTLALLALAVASRIVWRRTVRQE